MFTLRLGNWLGSHLKLSFFGEGQIGCDSALYITHRFTYGFIFQVLEKMRFSFEQ